MKTIEYKLQLIIDDANVKCPDDLEPYGEAFIASAITDRIKDRPQDLVKSFLVPHDDARDYLLNAPIASTPSPRSEGTLE
jgi:hypothetical protein